MMVYGSLLVLITLFFNFFNFFYYIYKHVFKVTIKIIFHHSTCSKTACKIYKLSIMMDVRGVGGHTKSYALLLIG